MIKIRNCSIEQFAKLVEKKECYCFGCGKQAEGFFQKYSSLHMEGNISGFIDNAQEKNGTIIVINGVEMPICSFQKFLEIRGQDSIVLTTSMYCHKMIEQMDAEPQLNDMECYVDFFIEDAFIPQYFKKTYADRPKIPKVIHYCWFGRGDIPAQFLSYIESWHRYCPEYEIIRWDETNYDVTKSRYMKQAYDAGKWAFVSDYARLKALSEYGGIYLDTDMEITKDISHILKNECFLGVEDSGLVNAAVIGAKRPHNEFIDKLIKQYENINEFDIKDIYAMNRSKVLALREEKERIQQQYQAKNSQQQKPQMVNIMLFGNNKETRVHLGFNIVYL